MSSQRPATGAPLIPATGAWREGMNPGQRKFFTMSESRPFWLEGGGSLSPITLAYETWGTLNNRQSNAVLVCHAWTGDSHVVGPAGHGHVAGGWWEGMVGPGQAIDTSEQFVVCVNVLGGCQGSTGPSSPDPSDAKPYGSRFPVVTIRDMVRTQAALADSLGVRKWVAVIGGSMGGMQALEWSVMFPERVGALIAIATCAQASAQQIALGAVGRRAIKLDPLWRGGDYYDAEPGDGPHQGLNVARELAQIMFRSDDVFTSRFGRQMADRQDGFSLWQRFEVERYLDYHGEKLCRRFDTNSYLTIGKAMDLHDVARGRGTLTQAMARVTAPTLAIGVRSDVLYPTYQQREIVDALSGRVPAEYVEIDSDDGHDGFLIEIDLVASIVGNFLADLRKVSTNDRLV